MGFLLSSIKRLEEAGLPLSESLAIVEDAAKKIESIPGPKGAFFSAKMKNVLKKNGALKLLQDVNGVLQGKEDAAGPANMSASDMANLKFCPLAIVDVERLFSIFKNILSERRQRFTEQNLKQTLIVNCFHARMI